MQKPSIGPSQAAKERATIEFEIHALQACANAHVVALLGVADVGGDTYIAMERCEGDLMQFIVPPRQLSEMAVAKMMKQAHVLARVHRKSIADACPAAVRRSSPRRSRTCTGRASFTST